MIDEEVIPETDESTENDEAAEDEPADPVVIDVPTAKIVVNGN